MRDLLPDAMRRRQWVVATLRSAFEAYGFEPLETPAMETAEVLLDKYGPDAERLIYRAGLGGESDLALRYDHSVSLARVCATRDELPRPFKRYQIGPVWRGERPQRGRYREFVQADADIVGTAGLLADAEIVCLALDGLARLGVSGPRLLLNHRKVLESLGRFAGVPESLLAGLYRAIDKRDALGPDGMRLELRAVGLPGELLNRQRQAVGRWSGGTADRARLEADLLGALPADAPAEAAATAVPRFLDALALAAAPGTPVGPELSLSVMSEAVRALREVYASTALIPDEAIERLADLLDAPQDDPRDLSTMASRLTDDAGQQGLADIRAVVDAVAHLGAPVETIAFDPAMVRGLEYYTGTIFEAVVPAHDVGSVLSGGRYDRLVGAFGRDMPAVGLSFGVDRIGVALAESEAFPAEVDRPAADVLVTRFDEPSTPQALALAGRLRAAGVRTEVYLDSGPIGDQIRFALRRRCRVVAIIGPDEVAAGTVTVRDLARRAESSVAVGAAVGAIQDAIAEEAAR
jgi:histidyl-tRNA synthetase